MALLNYTTGIEASASIAEIQRTLATHGAAAILAEYDDRGEIEALSFRILMNQSPVHFRLPSDWRPVLKVLQVQKEKQRRSGRSRIQATEEQARRVAWRIVKDWVEAQMAIVEIQMVKLDQVFLPYAVTPSGQTLYEAVKAGNLLSAPK